MADNIFHDWQRIISQELERDGIETNKAQRLANLIISYIEGALAMSRAVKTTQSLENMKNELELILQNMFVS